MKTFTLPKFRRVGLFSLIFSSVLMTEVQCQNTKSQPAAANPKEACEVLTPELIQQTLNIKVKKDKHPIIDFEKKEGVIVSVCSYYMVGDKASGAYLAISTYPDKKVMLDEWNQLVINATKHNSPPKYLAGLGDKAMIDFEEGYCHFEILKANQWISIDAIIEKGNKAGLRSKAITLAKYIMEKL